jgi:pSer/pThr/pTyr-binding forkhead associated (FHA) protein
MDAQERSPLILNWQQRRAVLDGNCLAVGLGKGLAVELRVEGPFTSRSHATIERRKHDYVLVDHSTNGTFVQTEDQQVAFVRRGEVRLWGEGWISLGESLSDTSAIRFRHG